ncbi:MAG: hypothetical protein Kow0089_08940 [Desulfobulbaceae bacterium]
MNGKMLRGPLIKSAFLLALFLLLVYLTATSPEGSLWGALGALFIGVFRIVQLSVGLVIALVFCLIVLTGIFLGCVALVSRESAGAMMDYIRNEAARWVMFVRSLLGREEAVPVDVAAPVAEGDVKGEEVLATLEASLDLIREDQNVADDNIAWLLERMEALERSSKTQNIAVERLAAVEKRLAELEEAMVRTGSDLNLLREDVAAQAGHEHADTGEAALEQLAARMETMEDVMKTLRGEVETVRNGLGTLRKGEKDEVPGTGEEQPRLFAHVPDKSMRSRIEKLVSETLQREMSYSQVIEYLMENGGGDIAEIIGAHPTLTREYIRFRRLNG